MIVRLHISATMIGVGLLFACGAPMKKAGDVKAIFANSEELSQKVTSLCTTLQQRQQAPNLAGVALANQVCGNAGSKAFNYNDLQERVGFTTFLQDSPTSNGTTTQTSDASFKIKTHSEVWLNRQLIQLAATLFDGLKNQTDGLLGQGGASSSKNEDFNFQIVGKPVFNRETFEFNIEFNLTSTKAQNGLVDINNSFRATGQMFDQKYIAVKAETTQIVPKEKSLIKSARILILIVPHSQDVYMVIATDFDFHAFGVDNAMAKEIESTLAKGLKAVPDLVAKLEKEQGISLTR